MTCNNQLGYTLVGTDIVSRTSPRLAMAACDGSVQGAGSVNFFSTPLPETGLAGSDAVSRFQRVADPDNANRLAYEMRLRQGDPQSNSGYRTEITGHLTLARAGRVWIGFSVRLPAAWKGAAATGVANSLYGADETNIFQVHQQPDVGDTNGNPSISINVAGGGAGSPQLSRMWVRVVSNPNAVSLTEATTRRVVWQEDNYPADQWLHFAIDLLPSWDAAQNPHLRIWRAVGNGDPVQIVNDAHPNQSNNVGEDYIKHGIYYYVNAWTAGITERVIHSKGLHRWAHSADMTPAAIVAYLRGI